MVCTTLSALACVATAADRTVTENWTLTQNETVDGTLTVYPGATVNLNGHDLMVKGLKGAAIMTDANGALYEQLEYIESDGTQYIVTDFTPAAGDRAEVQVAFTEDDKQFKGIISTRDGSGNNGFTIWRAYDGTAGYSLRLDYGTYNVERFLVDPVVNAGLNTTEIRRIVMHSGWPGNGQYSGVLKKEDGTDIAQVNLAAGSYTAPGPLVLMTVGWWNNGTLATRDAFNAKMRFYWLKFDADGAKCNIVPARRVSDGTLGVFNTVTLKFLPPAAGTFTKYGEISNPPGAFTVTSSVAGGELVVDVPENETVVNSSVTLSGSLKLTKTGKGTFTPGKTEQTYTGGTEVVDGLLVCSSPGYDHAFGAENSEIKISADAAAGTFGTFDVAGNYDYDGYHFIMNGGLFKNSSVAKDTYRHAQLARMTLTADSSFYTAGDYGFIAPGYVETTLELGGHTLTVSSDSDFYLCKTTVRNGTLDAASGSWILFGKEGTTANSWHVWFYDVLFKCAKPIKGNCTAHFNSGSVYQTDYTDGWNSGAQTMCIASGGTFRPGSHDFYRSTELWDGAILDLTRRTSALPTTSAFNPNAFDNNQGGVLSFIEGAKVAVKVDENSEFIKAAARQKGADGKPSGYIVSWTQPPANTVTFELAGEYAKSYMLHKMDGGLAIGFKPGLIIFMK